MKYFVSALVLAMFGFGADAASVGRPAMSNHIMSAPRYTASINALGPNSNKVVAANADVPVAVPVTEDSAKEEEKEPEKDMREAERNACINNNIGMGNTFVWASRYSDTSNYANMVEDAENPENNVCFVKVELNSTNESRIKVADIEPKYFMWDETIKCGSWVNKKDMEKRILDARKGERIGGIVASTVGGAGLGVGAMELFGNKLIGGKVQGQKSANKETLYKNALKKKTGADLEEYRGYLVLVTNACKSGNWYSEHCSLYEDLLKEISK